VTRKREVLLAHFLVGLYFAIQLLAFALPRSWRCVVGNYCCMSLGSWSCSTMLHEPVLYVK